MGPSFLSGTEGVTELIIPKTVTYMGNTGNDYYDSGALEGSNVTRLIFENGMTAIPARAARYLDTLTEVIIPETVTTICNYAFFGTSSLFGIDIPDSVTSIGSYAFAYSGLSSLKLPDSVKTINDYAFSNSGLTSVIIPDSVTSMGERIFYNCSSLTSVKLPASRINITSSTFSGCSSLTSIELPATVENIQSYAFNGCTQLREIKWSRAPKTIGECAFQDCESLVTDIPNTVGSIGNRAFSNCDSLTSIHIPDSVSSLGTYVFYDCDALTEVRFGNGLTTIPDSTFEHCDALVSFIVPYRVSSIGARAFKDSVSFKEITIPRAVTGIGSNAFSYLDRLTIYGVPGTYAETYANEHDIAFVAREVNASKVTLSETELLLLTNQRARLSFTVEPENYTDSVIWKSNDTGVAIVDDYGLVIGRSTGTAKVKLLVGNVSATCTVTVVQPVTGISLNASSRTMQALDTFQLTATVYPSDAYNKTCTWSSSDDSIASVDENGLVTAWKKGSATVTASAADGSGVTRGCTVTVTNSATVCKTPDELESPHNYPNSCKDFWVYTRPGAESLSVSFDSRTEMEDGFDYLHIYDGEGNKIGSYTGTELADQTVSAPGNTVRIQIVSDDSGNEWGFKVSGVIPIGVSTYLVQYDANGGIGAPDTQMKTPAQPLTLSSAIPTREGWYFAGWAESAEAAKADFAPGGSYTKDADTMLYAVWMQPGFALPSSLTRIDSQAFAGGTFSFVIIPEGVTSIAPDAFGDRQNLTILGKSGSYAETYAAAHGFIFIPEV